jgi:hypothetical protein
LAISAWRADRALLEGLRLLAALVLWAALATLRLLAALTLWSALALRAALRHPALWHPALRDCRPGACP